MGHKSSDNEQLQTDSKTNMMVSMLANEDKLKPIHEIVHYGDVPESEHNNDEPEKMDSYMNEEPEKERPKQNIPDPEPQQNNNMPQSTPEVTKPQNAEEVDEYDTATPERKKVLKYHILRQLAELVGKGVKLSQNYKMDSDYKTMKYEYELHKSIREKHNMVSFLSEGCVTTVGSLETANEKYNPFGLKLKGWCDNVDSKKGRLYDAFGGLYDKWFGAGKSLPPELALAGILGFSAFSTHFTNCTIDDVPSVEAKQKEDPQFLERIRQQAIGNTMDNKQQPSVFTDKINKEYKNVVEQARDYQQLRNYEKEYNNVMQQNPQGNNQQNNNQQTMKPPRLRTNIMYNNQEMSPSAMTTEQFNTFRANDIRAHRSQIEKQLEQRLQEQQNADNVSHTSVVITNPNIDDVIRDAENASNQEKPKKRQNRKGKKTNDSIKI